jgi:hypothetical protein
MKRSGLSVGEANDLKRDRETAILSFKMIRHATAPTPDDGGEHENAYDLATKALYNLHDFSDLTDAEIKRCRIETSDNRPSLKDADPEDVRRVLGVPPYPDTREKQD